MKTINQNKIEQMLEVYQQRCKDYDNDMAMANVPTPDECLLQELLSLIDEEKGEVLKEVEMAIKEQRTIIEDEMTGNQEASGYYLSGVSRMEKGILKALKVSQDKQ